MKYLWDENGIDVGAKRSPRKSSLIKLKSSPHGSENSENTLASFTKETQKRQITIAKQVARYTVACLLFAVAFFVLAQLMGFSAHIGLFISSADQLALAITACVFSFSLAFLVAGRHLIKPERMALSTSGVELFRSLANYDQIEMLPWNDVKKIDIARAEENKSSSRFLTLSCSKEGLGQTFYTFPVTNFGSKNWRKVLEELREYLPEPAMGPGLKQELQRVFGDALDQSKDVPEVALEKPVSYTEIWLRSLHDGDSRKNVDDLKASTRLCEGRFEIVSKLGSGGQGSVYLAKEHHPDNLSGDKPLVALKEFVLPDYAGHLAVKKVLDDVEREAQLLSRLKHNGIVKLQDTFIEDWRAYFVLEHLSGESFRALVERTGALPEHAVRAFALQMCDILSYLHTRQPQVVHRDFTPENLMLSNRSAIKLIDFNVALQAEMNSGKTVVGKRSFMPPEQFRGQPSSQSDIYALGGTLHFMATGQEPLPLKQSHPSTTNPTLSEGFNQIIEKCTVLSLTERFKSAEEVAQALKVLS